MAWRPGQTDYELLLTVLARLKAIRRLLRSPIRAIVMAAAGIGLVREPLHQIQEGVEAVAVNPARRTQSRPALIEEHRRKLANQLKLTRQLPGGGFQQEQRASCGRCAWATLPPARSPDVQRSEADALAGQRFVLIKRPALTIGLY